LLGEGDLENELKERAKALGIGARVHLLGFKDNVGEWLSGADLFLLTIKIEGVPGVVLEAAIQRIPTLAIDVGGVREVIIHEQTGFTLPSRDAKAFAFYADYLLEQTEVLTEMADNAREFVIQKFGLNRAVSEFEELYVKLLR
jgi:glycosyltransferase involved in cell wall biosynthesis